MLLFQILSRSTMTSAIAGGLPMLLLAAAWFLKSSKGSPKIASSSSSSLSSWESDPLTAVQNVFMIGGRPAYTAKFAVALANRAKVFAGPIRWKVNKGEKKEDLEVTAYAPFNDGDIAEVTLSWKIAAAEGWTRNKKYSTIPEQMLRWRSAKWLIDLHCPEILLGFRRWI